MKDPDFPATVEPALADLVGRLAKVEASLAGAGRGESTDEAREALDRAQGTLELRDQVLADVAQGVLICDENRRILYANAGFETITGYTAGEMLGKTCGLLQGEGSDPGTLRELRAALRAGQAFEGLILNYRKDGTSFWNQLSITPVHDDHGRLIRFIGIQRDFTERRRDAVVLRNSEERFAVAFENAFIGMALVSPDGRWLKVNRAVCELFGYAEEELLAKSFQEITHPEDLAMDLENLRRTLAGEIRTYQMEKRYLHRSGHVVRAVLSVSLARDEHGAPLYFISQIQDVTEQREAVEKLRRRDALLRIAGRVARIGGWSVQLDPFETIWSEEVCAIHELLPGSQPGFEETIEFYRPEYRAVVRDAFQTCAREGTPFDLEAELVTAKGRRIWVRSVGFAEWDEQEKITRVEGSFQDITDRRRAELAAVKAAETQVAIVRVQHDMVAVDLDLQGVMDLLADRARTLVGATGGVIELVDGEELVYRATSGVANNLLGTRLRRDTSLSGRAVETAEAQLCEDSECDPRVDVEACRKVGLRSMVIVPLRAGAEVIGVLKVLSDRPRAFTPGDVQNLWILVESLGVIIQRHRAGEQLRASEAQYRLLFAANPHPMWVFETETLRFLAVNRAAVRHYGYDEEEFLAMTVRDIWPIEDAEALETSVLELSPSEKVAGLRRHRKKDGSVIDVEVSSDGIIFGGRLARLTLSLDVTDRVRAHRALAMLSAGNESLIRIDDEHALIGAICRTAVEIGGYRMAWVGYARDDGSRRVDPVASAGMEEGYLSTIGVSWDGDRPDGRGPAGCCIRDGRTILCPDIVNNPMFSPWLEPALQRGYRSVVALPLRLDGCTMGTLVLYSGEARASSAEEVSLLEDLAEDLAFGIGILRSRQEARRMQEAVAEQAALLDKARDAILVRDLDQRITYWNKGAEDLYGWTAEEAIGRTVTELIFPAHFAVPVAGDEFLRSGEWAGELRKVTRDGREIVVDSRWTLLRDAEGVPKATLVIDSDATGRKKTQDALALAAKRMELAAKASKVGIWDWDVVTGNVHWDDQMYSLFGEEPRPDWVDYQFWRDRVHPEDVERAVAEIEAALLDDGKPFDASFRILIPPDGVTRHVRAQAIVFRDDEGRPVRMIGTNWDVTEQVEREKALREKLEDERTLRLQALAGERAKSEFLAVMSHEIRTPMNGILGFAEMLTQSRGLTAENRDLSETILSSGEALLRILDDILDFSRIEAGRLTIENAVFSTSELLHGIETLFARQAHAKGVDLLVRRDQGVPPSLRGDGGRIRQILVNLVGNAMKFTARGSIQVSARVVKDAALGDALEFVVRDTGEGISPDRALAIFEAFTQADSSTTRRHGGTGLGLTISRRLAELMGGGLRMSSQLGAGTEFTLLVPFSEAMETKSAPEKPQRASVAETTFARRYPLHILVVEDDRVNLKLIVSMLAKLGYHALSARNGLEAVAIYKLEAVDCILMDVQMPEMDGIEATREIRGIERVRALRPAYISALTANILPDDQRRCLAAGMNVYLNKPVKSRAIADMLVEAWNSRPPEAA